MCGITETLTSAVFLGLYDFGYKKVGVTIDVTKLFFLNCNIFARLRRLPPYADIVGLQIVVTGMWYGLCYCYHAVKVAVVAT